MRGILKNRISSKVKFMTVILKNFSASQVLSFAPPPLFISNTNYAI